MDKKKKIKILEILILIIIIITIITIGIIFYSFINNPSKLSESHKIKDYKITKYYKASLSPTEAKIYNIPNSNYITYESSTFTSYLIATDGIIDSIIEDISLNYIELPQDKKNELINYCNAYDEIKSGIKMKCTINKDFLNLNNEYQISKLFTNEIKTNYISFKLQLEYNEKVAPYIEKKDKEGILYREINRIE